MHFDSNARSHWLNQGHVDEFKSNVTRLVIDRLRSRVVYKFSCAGYGARYVGETSRHYVTHVRELLSTNRASHIHKHLQASESRRNLCTKNNFKILHSASSTYQLKIKEVLHILWKKPLLHKQVFHVNLGLFT